MNSPMYSNISLLVSRGDVDDGVCMRCERYAYFTFEFISNSNH